MRDWLPTPFSHNSVNFLLILLQNTNKNFQKFELQYSLDLLGCCAQMLYTDFSASRPNELLVFPRIGKSTTSQDPNLDSALLFTELSIASPIRLLLLFAIYEMLCVSFGSSLLFWNFVTLEPADQYQQVSLLRFLPTIFRTPQPYLRDTVQH